MANAKKKTSDKTESKKKTTTKKTASKKTTSKAKQKNIEKEFEEDLKQEVKTTPVEIVSPLPDAEIPQETEEEIDDRTVMIDLGVKKQIFITEPPRIIEIREDPIEKTFIAESIPKEIFEEEQVQEVETNDEEQTPDEEESKKVVKTVYRLKKLHGPHIDFNIRIIINILIILIIIGSIIKLTTMAYSVTKDEVIKYKENSSIDYKVYLKENDFYEQPYLDKGMAYVASLIDKIKINYNYFFTVNKNSDIDIENEVIAKLIITSQSNSNIFFEKEYVLTENTSEELKNGKNYELIKEVEIDYGYFNNLANKFRSNYAVNTSSSLEVYLKVKEKNKDTNTFDLNNENKTVLTIPLSEQEININLNNKNVNDEKQIVKKQEVKLTKPIYLVISAILALLLIIEIINLIRKLLLIKNKLSKYDKYINKILRGYDRVIVNVKTAPDLDKYNVIKVESFEELIDVRDNIKEPIKYLVIQEHQKSEFFITNHIDLYLYVIKEVDLENEKEKTK